MGDKRKTVRLGFQKWMVLVGDVRQLKESSKVILYGAALENILVIGIY